MITILSKQNSIANNFIAELRHAEIQQDRMRFRRNLERIGEIMAYEISKTLEYTPQEVETPLGVANCNTLQEQPVLVNIIRSGIPFHQGFLNLFDGADSGFIATYRHTKKSGEFEIQNKYTNTPNLDDKVVIVIDPMVATGRSMVMCCKDLLTEFNIKELHIASIVASEEGLQHIRAFVPEANLWIGDTDNELTSKSLIVPGMGKVGDLAYGGKE